MMYIMYSDMKVSQVIAIIKYLRLSSLSFLSCSIFAFLSASSSTNVEKGRAEGRGVETTRYGTSGEWRKHPNTRLNRRNRLSDRRAIYRENT